MDYHELISNARTYEDLQRILHLMAEDIDRLKKTHNAS